MALVCDGGRTGNMSWSRDWPARSGISKAVRSRRRAAAPQVLDAPARHPRNIRAERGFSLTEMAVVTGITGLLAATAFPSLGGFLGENRAAAVTNEFVFSLQTARSEAIKRIRPVVVCPSSDVTAAQPGCAPVGYESGWIVYVDENSNANLDAGESVLLRNEAPEGNVAVTSTGIGTRVRFNSTGASVHDGGSPLPGSLTISIGDKQRLVTVQANGRVRSKVL